MTSSPDADTDTAAGPDDSPPTLLEQMGGVAGLVYSTVPVVVFVTVNGFFGLQPAIWAALGIALAIVVLRLVRKEPIQPAISGLFGVGIAVFIAHRTGSAKGFFLFGIWSSLIYGGLFLASVVMRWPLVGVIWSTLNNHGMTWRRDRASRLAYDVATLTWMLVFGARFVVQRWLYDTDQTGWLAFARIAMGWPLTAVAALVTVWAVRRVTVRHKELTEHAELTDAEVEAELRARYAEPRPREAQ